MVFPDHTRLFFYLYLIRLTSSFAIIMKRKRKPIALQLLSYRCIDTINVLWLFLTVPWVGLQCVIVVFTDYTHLILLNFLYVGIRLCYLRLQRCANALCSERLTKISKSCKTTYH